MQGGEQSDNPSVGKFVTITLDISATQNWSYKLGGLRVFSYQLVFCRSVDNKGIIASGLYTVVDGNLPFAKWLSSCLDFPLNALLDFAKHDPALTFSKGTLDRMLSNIIAQLKSA